MLRLSRHLRVSVVAVVLAMVGSLLLGAAPVQADLDPCLPQFQIRVESDFYPRSGGVSEVIIGPAGVLTGAQRMSGYVVDRCPGDGKFDEGDRLRYQGRVWLRDGTSYAVTIRSRGQTFSARTHVPYDRHSARGLAEAGVWMTDSKGHWVYDTKNFYVRRDVKMTFNAGPEPVEKGATIKVSGIVTRLTFNAAGAPKYVPYVKKTVDIYWNPVGSGGIRRVAAVTTNASGAYSKGFVATRDAVWFVRTSQTAYHAAPVWIPGDFVNVQ